MLGALIAGAMAAVSAQRLQPAPHAVHSIPRIPIELLERAVTLRSGIGEAHDAAATTSAEAQRFYDQGLAYLHSYVWIEAARSFNQALRLDPKLALAHAGLSVAYVEVNQPAAARTAIERARTLSAGLPDHDRRHVELRALQMAAEDAPRDTSKLDAYRKALDAALVAFPQDAELLLLRGIAESPDPAERGQGSPPSSAKYYERALGVHANHFAAHHYLTHAMENSGRVQEGLTHGRTYAKLAPQVPHARHMHGHNLRRTGRIDEAIAEFEAADRLQRAYFKAESVPAEYDWHFHHNLDLLATSYQYTGQMKKAEAILKDSFALPSNLVAQLFNKREWPVFLRARGRYDEAFEAAKILKGHPHPLVQAVGFIESGEALLGTGRFGDAGVEFNAALKILRGGVDGGAMAANALLALQGHISLRSAQRDKGRQVLEEVARRLRAAPGPDNWIQTLFALESLARAARQVGDWELAGRLAQQMLEHDPAYAGTRYALALVAERNENAAVARQEFGLAAKYWSKADADLPEFQDARRKSR